MAEFLEILKTTAAFLTPVLAFVTAFLGVNAMRNRDKHAAGNADRQVNISEKDSHTKEVEMIFSGFSSTLKAQGEQLARLTQEQKESGQKYDELSDKYDDLSKKYEILSEENRVFRVQRDEMLEHILDLERLVPNPPGPPLRPTWMPT